MIGRYVILKLPMCSFVVMLLLHCCTKGTDYGHTIKILNFGCQLYTYICCIYRENENLLTVIRRAIDFASIVVDCCLDINPPIFSL